LLLGLSFLQASEQYFTASQFLAHDLRHVISRPQAWQGLLGKLCLFPLNETLDVTTALAPIHKHQQSPCVLVSCVNKFPVFSMLSNWLCGDRQYGDH
jgi:hypothetical protein